MRILVTFAVEAEFAPWRRQHKFQKLNGGAVDVYCSQIGNAEVCVLFTGIGCRKAWVQATRVIWPGDIDICISSGFAGSLRPAHVPGDILAAREVRGQIPGMTLRCDEPLVELATECGAKAVGSFLTSDRVVVEAVQKQRLGAVADAVEMESACVLSEAASFGSRSVAIRTISDSAEDDLPIDFNRTTSKFGDVEIRGVLGEIARQRTGKQSASGEANLLRVIRGAADWLGRVDSFYRFFVQTHVARENLAEFLSRYVERLAQTSDVVSRKVATQ